MPDSAITPGVVGKPEPECDLKAVGRIVVEDVVRRLGTNRNLVSSFRRRSIALPGCFRFDLFRVAVAVEGLAALIPRQISLQLYRLMADVADEL